MHVPHESTTGMDIVDITHAIRQRQSQIYNLAILINHDFRLPRFHEVRNNPELSNLLHQRLETSIDASVETENYLEFITESYERGGMLVEAARTKAVHESQQDITRRLRRLLERLHR